MKTRRWVEHYDREGRKIIAFKAGYAELLRAGLKSTTVRLLLGRSYKFTPGEECIARVSGQNAVNRTIRIVEARCDLFRNVVDCDLRGESPDSVTREGLRCVLGNLSVPAQYITDDTPVQVLKFVYID